MTLPHRIASEVSSEYHLDPTTAAGIVDLVLTEAAEAVARGDELILPGVGTLRAEHAPDRRDHHPSTGVSTITPAAVRVVFSPAS